MSQFVVSKLEAGINIYELIKRDPTAFDLSMESVMYEQPVEGTRKLREDERQDRLRRGKSYVEFVRESGETMSRALAELLGSAAAGGAADAPPQLILDAASYAQRVLLQNRDVPWHDATAYANHLGQLQALLKPAVALVALDRMLQHEIESNEQCRLAMAARSRTGFAAKTLLADEGVRQRAQDLIAAVVKTQREPVALQLMSPLALLTLTDRAVDPASTAAFDADDAEGTAIYVADWLRAFAEFDVAGVVFDERGDGGVGGALAESYQPIANVAEHYGWTLGFRGSGEVRFTSPAAVIPVLGPGVLFESAPADLPPSGLLFAEIPEDAVPERVLARLEGLRGVGAQLGEVPHVKVSA